MSRMLLTTVLCALLAAVSASAGTLIVPDHYPLILDAMFFANRGDTVLVRCGTYYESGIQMKPGVTLISETGQSDCATINAQNMGGILSCVDCDSSTAVIGFRLSSGFMTSGYGAGISCTRSAPRLENLEFLFCQVRSPTSYGGGGLGCLDSSPTLTNCRFQGCVLDESTVGGGGAMVAAGQSSPTLNDVVFEMNWTTESWGGALSVEGYGGQLVRLNNVTFIDNDSPTTGGALHVSGSTTVVDGATFEGNWAHEGGAVHLATCRPCTLRDITFTGNTAAYGRGGGLLCEMSPDGVATMSDLTFIDNTAATGGGGMACHNATTTPISHATFAGNSAATGGGLDVSGSAVVLSSATFCQNEATSSGGGIYLDGASSIDLDASIVAYSTDGEGIAQWGSAPQVITCTDIYGNADGDWVGPFAAYQGVAGNFSEQPLFCELLNRIFTLHVDSPCLPHANDCGTLIGAHGVGCPSTGVSECGVSLVRAPTPNPFGRSTSISYELREPSVVSARVYDASGRLVRVLLNSEPVAPGTRVLTWDGESERGGAVASGVYFVKLELDGRTHTSRAVLIR